MLRTYSIFFLRQQTKDTTDAYKRNQDNRNRLHTKIISNSHKHALMKENVHGNFLKTKVTKWAEYQAKNPILKFIIKYCTFPVTLLPCL